MERKILQVLDFDFGESEIHEIGSEISDLEFQEEMRKKKEAPLSFKIETGGVKIKFQLYDDIGEKQINALISGVSKLTNNVLEDAEKDTEFIEQKKNRIVNKGNFHVPGTRSDLSEEVINANNDRLNVLKRLENESKSINFGFIPSESCAYLEYN